MKNKLIDLNDHLFSQLERLNDEEIKGDQLRQEIDRSRAVSDVGKQIIANARLALDAEIAQREYTKFNKPEMVENAVEQQSLGLSK